MQDQERRRGARKSLGCTVMLAHDSGHRLCRLRELSLSGAMLDVGWSALTHDTPVRLMVDLPAESGVHGCNLPAVVARVSTGGTAIRFGELETNDKVALSEYLNNS